MKVISFASWKALKDAEKAERRAAELYETGHRLVKEAYSEEWSYLFDDVLKSRLLYFNSVAELNDQRTWLDYRSFRDKVVGFFTHVRVSRDVNHLARMQATERKMTEWLQEWGFTGGERWAREGECLATLQKEIAENETGWLMEPLRASLER